MNTSLSTHHGQYILIKIDDVDTNFERGNVFTISLRSEFADLLFSSLSLFPLVPPFLTPSLLFFVFQVLPGTRNVERFSQVIWVFETYSSERVSHTYLLNGFLS